MLFDSDEIFSGGGFGLAEKARVILVARLTRWKMDGRLMSVATAAAIAVAVVEQFCDDEDSSSGIMLKSETLP